MAVVIDGHYFRGATGRSGELGFLPRRKGTPESPKLQHLVSLSALRNRLTQKGYRISSPRDLMHLNDSANRIIDSWIDDLVEALEEALLAIDCIINPEAILIGNRLPPALVDRLASRLNERLSKYESTLPSIATVCRAALAEDAPALGAATLPFSDRFGVISH